MKNRLSIFLQLICIILLDNIGKSFGEFTPLDPTYGQISIYYEHDFNNTSIFGGYTSGDSTSTNIITDSIATHHQQRKNIIPHEDSFFTAVLESISVTLVSELGDNTFFITAILAMQYSRLVVFFGAFTALSVMHALSVSLGMVMSIVPKVYTFYASTIMLVFFGMRMLRDAYGMSADEGLKGFEAMEKDFQAKESKKELTKTIRKCDDKDDGDNVCGQVMNSTSSSNILMKVFSTTMLAEFGDRSQLTTLVMSTRQNAFGIIVGGAVGRTVVTGLAVIGGRLVAKHISIRTVTFIGGILFLMFALSSIVCNEEVLNTVII